MVALSPSGIIIGWTTSSITMLGCQFSLGVVPGCGPGGTCLVISEEGGSGGVWSCSHRGRGSGEGVLMAGGFLLL